MPIPMTPAVASVAVPRDRSGRSALQYDCPQAVRCCSYMGRVNSKTVFRQKDWRLQTQTQPSQKEQPPSGSQYSRVHDIGRYAGWCKR